MRTYKFIRSLRPCELYDILTLGSYPEFKEHIKVEMNRRYGERDPTFDSFLGRDRPTALDSFPVSISDGGLMIYIDKKDKATEVFEYFLSLYDSDQVSQGWYSGNGYMVGFWYREPDFIKKYTTFKREKSLNEIFK